MSEKMHQGTIAGTMFIIFSVLIFAGFPGLSFGADNGFTVFQVEIDTSLKKSENSKPVKDFYINGGEDDGLGKSTVLDVYREKIVRDIFNNEDFKIRVPVGKLKVIKLFKKVAITRIISLESSDKAPVLLYRTVMIGDYAVPVIQQADKKKQNNVSGLTNKIPGKDIKIQASSSGVSLPSKVLFAVDDWKLNPEAIETLSAVHDVFNHAKDNEIIIEGHTCSLGTDEYNLELSRKRAQGVSDVLLNTIGIPVGNIQTKYYGEQFPVASNSVEEGRVRNRRVDIRFQPRDKTDQVLQSSAENKSSAVITN
jgi:outer membrane protein OmpA-like peptidoglycan-associated protein